MILLRRRSQYHPRLTAVAVCLMWCCVASVVVMADAVPKPQDDFGGYMEGMSEAKAEAQLMRDRMDRHRVWRETTWGGFAVRQIQALGSHFSGFFVAFAGVMENDNSVGSIIIMNVLRVLIICMVVSMVYFGGYLLQTLIGSEYVIEEEEIVIVDDEGDEDKKVQGKRSARDKRKKQ